MLIVFMKGNEAAGLPSTLWCVDGVFHVSVEELCPTLNNWRRFQYERLSKVTSV